jgi:amicyanin
MYANVLRYPRRLRLAGLSAVTAGVLALTACGSGSSQDAAIEPGTGQSLAGVAGATGAANGSDTTMPGMSDSEMPGMQMPSTGNPGAATAPVAAHAVAIKNFAFAPTAVTVKVGTTITWTNKDSDAHTVTSTGSGGPLNSPALSTGQTFSFTFTTAGSYSYFCTIHPFMTATVVVTA